MTIETLLAAWALRDARYRRRRPLCPGEADLIRHYRRPEIDDLPPRDRGRAWRVLQLWPHG